MNFTTLTAQPSDPILSMAASFASDLRAEKIDLGLGVYRDVHGATPVMGAVKQAEDQLLSEQASKVYLGVEGDPVFVSALQSLIFGGGSSPHCIGGFQAVGGTGALRLAADLLAVEQMGRTVWIGMPSWPNHAALFKAAGLETRTFRHSDPVTQTLYLAAIEAAIAAARPGDAIVLHGACHNPTGIDMDAATWRHIGELLAARQVLPVVDMAYHGFGVDLEEDLVGFRALLDVVPAALLAYSCSKNFALYRERVGALFVVGSRAGVDLALSNMMPLARANYSMPPDHGAAVVRTILQSPQLSAAWRTELAQMRTRVSGLRTKLGSYGQAGRIDLAPLGRQNGFFSMLAVTPDEVATLREDHGIYIVPNGRVNVAGLREEQLDAFVAGLAALGR